MKKFLFLSVVMLALMLVLVACQAAPTGTEPAAPTPEAQPVASDSDYDYVAGKSTMIIGYTVYAPMNFTDSSGNFTGFDTELAIAVCEKLDVEPDFVEINWDTKEIELNAKSIDCIWNGLTITDARKETMSITNPYVQNAQVVVMKTGAGYTDTSMLVGKTVCAEAGSAGEEAILGDDNLVNAEYVARDVQTSCLMEVSAGTAAAAVLDLTLAKAMIGPSTDYANLEIVDRLAVEDYGVAFRKGSDLCDKVNEVFKQLLEDGTMAALADKYGLDLSK